MRSFAALWLCGAWFGCDSARIEPTAVVDAALPAAEFTTAEDYEPDAIAEFKDVTPDQLADIVTKLEAELP